MRTTLLLYRNWLRCFAVAVFFIHVEPCLARRQWDRTVVSKDNIALQYVPLDAEQIYKRCQEVRSFQFEHRDRWSEIKLLSEPGMIDGLTRLMDFLCLASIYYLEGPEGDMNSSFGLARQKTKAVYTREQKDFEDLMIAWGMNPPNGFVGMFAEMLRRLEDERALPILARLYFFQADDKAIGDDSAIIKPAAYGHLPMFTLIRKTKPELLASLPKRDHTMWNKNFYDETRKWILANKATLLPAGVPKFANVQEAPFLEYIAKKEAAALANPQPEDEYIGYNGIRTPENRRRIFLGAAVLAGLLLLFVIARLVTKRSDR